MIIYADAMVCFYMLIGQSYLADTVPSKIGCVQTELITNENIYDINDLPYLFHPLDTQ